MPQRAQVLGELQDRLAPFSSAVAYALIEEELGQPVSAVFEYLSPEPVAAASLGQARCKRDALLLDIRLVFVQRVQYHGYWGVAELRSC